MSSIDSGCNFCNGSRQWNMKVMGWIRFGILTIWTVILFTDPVHSLNNNAFFLLDKRSFLTGLRGAHDVTEPRNKCTLSEVYRSRLDMKLHQSMTPSGRGDGTQVENSQEKTFRKSSSSYWISPDQLEHLKESVNIVSVVETYGLSQFQRKSDDKAVAVCPFHNDHNPSLSIDGTRGLYKCFSCGAGGDVFNFVREYSAIQDGEDSKLTFAQAVRHVAKEFGDSSISIDGLDDLKKDKGRNRMSDEEKKVIHAKKQRLMLANAAAAAFYGDCLMTRPSAGLARSHLIDRGISPGTVRKFAIGYAPDVYYGTEKAKGPWGTGSLVNRLREMGFTAEEIVDAGLATRTKKKVKLEDIEEKKGTKAKTGNRTATSTNTTNVEAMDFSNVMDRFRGRLMVPIFDSNGKHVLGFGGRILASSDGSKDGDHKTPKYINSPESLVFSKKQILFGQHHAREAVKKANVEAFKESKATGLQRKGGEIIIVEGYLDAITLSDAGLDEVVACMGTALTTEQLSNAAVTAGTRGGRIILCLDGDEAGINAVERLCNSKLLLSTCESYVVEVFVAELPDGIKDPAEFIEEMEEKENPIELFRSEVLETAKEWTVWYLDRLMSDYDPNATRGEKGTFSDVCERISNFLSTFPNPADRTKRAFEAAGTLADTIAKGSSGSSGSNNALRIQLESDLVSMTSRKASARESVERRIESVDGISPDGIKQKLANIASGEGLSGSDDDSKVSYKYLNKANKLSSLHTYKKRPPKFQGQKQQAGVNYSVPPKGDRRRKMQRGSPRAPPPLTPHFSGFEFDNQNDADWLGITKGKKKLDQLTLGTGPEFMMTEKQAAYFGKTRHADAVAMVTTDKIVYFNSNTFHGNQFLTPEAVNAGYTNKEITVKNSKVLEHGVGSLIARDAHRLHVASEENLLRTLVEYRPARMAMKAALSTSEATGSHALIDWSCPERQWLFERLIESSLDDAAQVLDSENVQQLWEYLSGRDDAPDGAFGNIASVFRVAPTQEVRIGDAKSKIEKETNNAVQQSLIGDIESVAEPKTTLLGSTVEMANSDEHEGPSEMEDIDDWASSYDPSLFDDDFNHMGNQDLDVQGSITTEAEVIPSNSDEQLGEQEPIKVEEGVLDVFFVPKEDLFIHTYDESIPREVRAELMVQESLSILLRETAAKELTYLKRELVAVSELLDSRLALEGTNEDVPQNRKLVSSNGEAKNGDTIEMESVESLDLKKQKEFLAQQVAETSQRVNDLTASSKRISSRLLDYSSSGGIEGTLSHRQQEELAKDLDDYLENLPDDTNRPKIPGFDDRYSFGDDQYDDVIDPSFGGSRMTNDGISQEEALEYDLKRIEDEWGEWSNDKFDWSPETKLSVGGQNYVPTGSMLDESLTDLMTKSASELGDSVSIEEGYGPENEEEPLDDTMARIDEEWADWDSHEMF